MAYSKLLLLLVVFILGFLGQSSSNSGGKKNTNVKGPLPVVKTTSMSDAAMQLRDWDKFKKRYFLTYKNKQTEDYNRNLFMQNLDFIKTRTKMFAMKDTFKLEINRNFGTENAKRIQSSKCLDDNGYSSNLPCLMKKPFSRMKHNFHSKDWRSAKIVSEVKDQGACKSCWAFSAVAVLESWFALRNHKLVEFSPQQMLDCHHDSPSKSCNISRGVSEAFKILENLNGKLATLAAYSYTRKSISGCALSKKKVTIDKAHIYNFTGKCSRLYAGSPSQKENQLKEAVARYGPVSVSINTQLRTFKFYKRGIYNDKECHGNKLPSHAVTVVGFGYEKNKGYWIIKNSWGTDWGEDGYMKLAMGYNLCGIANFAYFITEADDIEDDIKETKSLNLEPKVGSGSSSLHGVSDSISVNIICYSLFYLVFAHSSSKIKQNYSLFL